MGAKIVSHKIRIFALSIFLFIFAIVFIPQALASTVTLTVSPSYNLADGYSTSIATANVDTGGQGQTMDFTITDSSGPRNVLATTDTSGTASIAIGPYPFGVPDTVNVKATCNGVSSGTKTIVFLAKNNLNLLVSPTSANVGSHVNVTAIWAGSSGVPLTFTAYDPGFTQITSQSVATDGSGMASFSFDLSDTAGYNWVVVSLNGATIKSKYVMGTGGHISEIQLKSNPVSPVYADDKTSYTVQVKALDDKGNVVPGKNISIYIDGEKTLTYPTNSNGLISVAIGSSAYVRELNITAIADDTLASKSINLSYIRGNASSISALANPPVVANANISTVPGQAEVHTTDIVTVLTDVWGHPVPNETVYVALQNTSLGSMYVGGVPAATVSGITDESGQYTCQFKLGDEVFDSDIDVGVPIFVWYNNSTTGVNTSATCYVLYTDHPFVVATTSYSPMTNLTVNDTINVTVRLRACGWVNRTNYNNSAILLFDTSGSMDWLANTIYPADGQPEQGYVSPATSSARFWNGHDWQYMINPMDWHLIDTYTYSGDGSSSAQFMLSSDYRAYNGGTGSFYFLKVVDPDNNAYGTDNGGCTVANVVAVSSANENSVKFTNAKNGQYKIYGAYVKSGADTPYNFMVLTDPKRLGQNTGGDMGSAAKVAGTKFVSLMNKNQVGVVWFNDSYPMPPVAKFTATPLVGNKPLAVQFTDQSSNAPSSWAWIFGDGGTANVQNPAHTYANPGKYNVKLTVTNTGGTDSVTYNNYITVRNATPNPSFSAIPTSGFVPLTVQFSDATGDASITGWLWDFGDGQTSTSKNPVHQYTSTGSYTVSLTQTNDGGTNTKTVANYITVNPHNAPPVADFIAVPTSTTANVSVTFTDKSTGVGITARQWNFGDGTANSTLVNPTHAFTNAGTYTITLTVTNDGGSDTEVKTAYITVTNNIPPVANFSGTPLSGNKPLNVQFTDSSTGTAIYLRQWNFGDGTANSTAVNPLHTYANAGLFTVTLTVFNDGGKATMQKVDYINVTTPAATPTPTATPTATPQPPTVDFKGVPTSGYAPLGVQFTDLSTNSPTSWAWDFGDGGTSTSQNPNYIYNNPGTYTVKLTASNSAGGNTATKTNYITVLAHNPAPVADFTGSPTTGNVPLGVGFTDKSTGINIYNWFWTFGDGATDTVKNPIHTYASAGTYTVTLTVTNDNGSSTATKTSYITVTNNAPPVASFTENPSSGNIPLTVHFTDTSSGNNIYSYYWTFGDGGWDTAKSPNHVYNSVGTFVVTLTVTNDAGSSSATQTVVVSHNAPPVANFVGSPTSGNIPLTVTFTDKSTGNNINGWLWDFGDGQTSTLQNPPHQYTSAGFYTVKLTVTNDAGSDSMTIPNYIVAYNAVPTIPPMLTGILGDMLGLFSMPASAGVPSYPPAGTAIVLTTINNVTAPDVNSSIYGLRAYGGTNIAAGITQSISEFNSGSYTHGNRKYIILLTDGYSQYPDQDIQAAHDAANQSIVIYTVGIGMPDENTLKNIAQITGGTYTKVTSLPDLVNTFSAIANNMTDVAGNNISLHTFTNYTNGLSPDTRYIPNSSIITKPDGSKVHQEPLITQDDPGHEYSLVWDGLGSLSFNQNMTIFYQLKVMTPGNITPITNDSYVEFWMSDGMGNNSSMRSFVEAPQLNVRPAPDNITGIAPPDLTVTITSPPDNVTITSNRLLISWDTIYTGNDKYDQIVSCNGVPLVPPAPNNFTDTESHYSWPLTWDISTMPSGNYTIVVYAYDSYCNSTATVNVTIDHSTGMIRLE